MSEDEGGIFRVLTANRLNDGVIVYLRLDGDAAEWVTELKKASSFDEGELEEALARARTYEDDNIVTGVYEIEVAGRNRPLNARERVRAQGPSIRFGKAATEPDFSI